MIYNCFRKDNILFAACLYTTMIGSLVIIIKKLLSRQIVKKIPKSNILPQHRIVQEPSSESFQMATLHSTPRIVEVGHNAETDTGNPSMPCQSSTNMKKMALDISFIW